MRAEGAGLIVLAVLSLLPFAVVEVGGESLIVWLVGFGALAVLAVFAWRSERWPARPTAALRLAALATAAAALVFSLTALIVWLAGAPSGFVEAGLKGGIGLALALALCPCLTSIALAGAVRNLVRREEATK